MTEAFDKDYWDSHWQQADGHGPGEEVDPNPYLVRAIGGLAPGTALDAGCGDGAEAIRLAASGWQVTAADISAEALARACERTTTEGAAPELVEWIEADLSVWQPGRQFDLVTTHYAHPADSQLAFYLRISDWVAPGGTLLIVGHRPTAPTPEHGHGHGHPPDGVSVTAASISAALDADRWDIVIADEPIRTLADRTGRTVPLDDVVVRATRRP
jgi:SAM-dependent methyltransferase